MNPTKTILTAALLALALAGCQAGKPVAQAAPGPQETPAVSAPATLTTPTPTAKATPTTTASVFPMGGTLQKPGWSATVLVSQAKALPQGHHDQPLFGVMAQTCNISAEAFYVTGAPWSVVTADGSLFKVASTTWENDPVPQYPVSSNEIVAPTQCVKGWLLFEVPTGSVISTVRYGRAGDDGLATTGEWSVT